MRINECLHLFRAYYVISKLMILVEIPVKISDFFLFVQAMQKLLGMITVRDLGNLCRYASMQNGA